MLDIAKFVKLRSRLYHFAAFGAWPSIREHGLFSTSALLTKASVSEEARKEFAAARRKECVPLHVVDVGTVTIRDQIPLCEKGLTKALNGCMSNEAWIDLLDSRVFFWTNPGHAEGLTQASAYREQSGLLICVRTEGLLRNHREKVRVATFNTGYTLRKPVPRSGASFMKLEEYPESSGGRIKEFTVLESVPDVAEHVEWVREWNANDTPTYLYQAS